MIADVPAGLPTPDDSRASGSARSARSRAAPLALALVALAESIGAARSLAAQRGYEIDPNQELVALGASNVGAGLLQGFPVDASLSRSAVGAGAGVRTRLSGLFVAVLLVATMLFLTPLFDGLPQATLAAIIIAAVIGLVDVKGFRWLWRIDQGDAQLAIVGFAAVALLGVLPGIVIAVVASLLALIRRAYRPRIAVLGRVDRRDERRRGLPVPRHRPPSRVRDDSRARPVPVLERALLRQRRLLPRRDPAARGRVRSARTHRPRRRVGDQPRRHDGARDARRPDRPARRSGASRSSSRASRRRSRSSSTARASTSGSGPSAGHRSVHAGVRGVPRRSHS